VSESRESRIRPHEGLRGADKRYEVLTDPGEVHTFSGPRWHYLDGIIRAPIKTNVVIGLDWYGLLSGLKIAPKHDEEDIVDDAYFRLQGFGKDHDHDVGDDYRRAVLKLLRTWPCFGEPLARKMLNRVANELELLWWPKAGRPALVPPKTRERGVDRPRTTALKDAKEFFGYRSIEAVRKAMQPSRHRRPKPA
jgi:hypothetical protein